MRRREPQMLPQRGSCGVEPTTTRGSASDDQISAPVGGLRIVLPAVLRFVLQAMGVRPPRAPAYRGTNDTKSHVDDIRPIRTGVMVATPPTR
jgi:hypothetical protein